MYRKAWSSCLKFPEEGRNEKPRLSGCTMVIDKGLGIIHTEDLLKTGADYIDFIKFGFGTAALYGEYMLQQKINLIHMYNIHPYFGGTMLEIAIWQKKVDMFFKQLHKYGIRYIEVSDGTISLDASVRASLIKAAVSEGFKVFSEIGKKDPSRQLPIDETRRMIYADLECGAEKVILEGRESGKNAGIFDSDGKIIEDRFEDLKKIDQSIQEKIIWEAPLKSQQEELILQFGPNVNLGNIPVSEVFALESLRRGLRSDTLRHKIGENTYFDFR